jgi:hypothetical protein
MGRKGLGRVVEPAHRVGLKRHPDARWDKGGRAEGDVVAAVVEATAERVSESSRGAGSDALVGMKGTERDVGRREHRRVFDAIGEKLDLMPAGGEGKEEVGEEAGVGPG